MSSIAIWCHLVSSDVIWCHLLSSDVFCCHLMSLFQDLTILKLFGEYKYLYMTFASPRGVFTPKNKYPTTSMFYVLLSYAMTKCCISLLGIAARNPTVWPLGGLGVHEKGCRYPWLSFWGPNPFPRVPNTIYCEWAIFMFKCFHW